MKITFALLWGIGYGTAAVSLGKVEQLELTDLLVVVEED